MVLRGLRKGMARVTGLHGVFSKRDKNTSVAPQRRAKSLVLVSAEAGPRKRWLPRFASERAVSRDEEEEEVWDEARPTESDDEPYADLDDLASFATPTATRVSDAPEPVVAKAEQKPEAPLPTVAEVEKEEPEAPLRIVAKVEKEKPEAPLPTSVKVKKEKLEAPLPTVAEVDKLKPEAPLPTVPGVKKQKPEARPPTVAKEDEPKPYQPYVAEKEKPNAIEAPAPPVVKEVPPRTNRGAWPPARQAVTEREEARIHPPTQETAPPIWVLEARLREQALRDSPRRPTTAKPTAAQPTAAKPTKPTAAKPTLTRPAPLRPTNRDLRLPQPRHQWPPPRERTPPPRTKESPQSRRRSRTPTTKRPDIEVPVEVEALLAAAEEGDAGSVRSLLDAGVDVDSRDPQDGYAALIIAAEEGRLEVVKCLVNRGARLEVRDAVGRTPLFAAAAANRAAVVSYLVDRGADPLVVDYDGRAVFWAACAVDAADAVRALLDRARARRVDVDINAKDPECGLTAVEFAAHRGHATILRLLRERGAKEDSRKARLTLHL